jgi:acyl-CoA synthetase (AMP-forming)/AMP-acid ligase II
LTRQSFFADFLQTISDRSRQFMALVGLDATQTQPDFASLCEALLRGQGEASGLALAQEILAEWRAADSQKRLDYLLILARKFGPDLAKLETAVETWQKNRTPENAIRLHEDAEPRRQELIRRLNMAPGATATLLELRTETLDRMTEHKELKAVDADLLHLISSWFNRGFLVMRPIDWTTSASLLEKVIKYEAVHAIANWDDLRRRLAPADRRCFAFFHPRLPDEPLIFVEVALMDDAPSAIAEVLAEDRDETDVSKATTAVFYSISNCQVGLRGVSFGNFLLKQVVEELQREYPALRDFVTLSPVPGFAAWLRDQEAMDIPLETGPTLGTMLARPDWHTHAVPDAVTKVLEPLLATYLLAARGRGDQPLDPVARFHLGNGASLDRLNMLGDVSPRGLKNAHGAMVNYRYHLKDLEKNHELYAVHRELVAAPAVRKLVQTPKAKEKANEKEQPATPAVNHFFDQIRACMPGDGKPFIHTGDGRTLTYGDMLRRSSELAHALVALGVKPGDRVAMQTEKCTDALMLYIACIRAGAALLPLNTAYTIPELDYFFTDAKPALIVCAPEAKDEIGKIAGTARVATLSAKGGTLCDAVPKHAPDFVSVARGPEDLASILYTSGTTGRSKGAMLTHENLASNARVLTELWQFTSKDVLIHALPIFHIHGLFVATNVTLFAGASMIFQEKFNVNDIVAAMPRATALMGVPTFYVRLVEHPGLTPEATKSIRLFVSGSAPLLPETFHAFRTRTGHSILERYGMTETGMITSNPYEGERIAETVGRPLPGISVRIADPDTGKLLPNGEIGVIEVRGPNVFAGYWNMPEKTASEFRDGYFITGDLGTVDDAGYVRILGRGKDLVISGGFNVYPKEVESEIDSIDGVIESAVIGVPHPDFGEGVTAIVVRAPSSKVDESKIVSTLEARLAKFKQPKKIVFVEELPRNTMGKVQKAVLREQYGSLYKN